MAQLTVRATDALLDRVKAAAAARGTSTNEYVTRVLSAATDPDLAGSEAARIRERLTAAGLLEPQQAQHHTRPPARRVAQARRAAGQGTRLSDLVNSERG